MDNYKIYITFILLLKLTLIIIVLGHLYFVIFDSSNELDKNFLYWRERIDFTFKIAMAILLFYIFNPFYDNTDKIDHETKLFFYLFGIILIITADWSTFIKESKFFHNVQTELE